MFTDKDLQSVRSSIATVRSEMFSRGLMEVSNMGFYSSDYDSRVDPDFEGVLGTITGLLDEK
jgi:hypothetical protein